MVLLLVGTFMVALAVLFKWYAAGQLMKTPLDVNSTTSLAGDAAISDDPATAVKATSITRANSQKSDDDVVVFVNSQCLVKDEGDVPNCVSADDPQERLISASTDDFATDRKTALAVNDPKYLPADAEAHRGLVNKWPFESEKKTYPYWDGTTGRAVPADFDGTTELNGLEVYKYHIEVTDEPVTITDGVEGTYSSSKTIYVEPNTGSVVNQVEERTLTTEEGDNFLTLNLAFTPEEVQDSVDDASSGADTIKLLRDTVPLIGFIVGIPLLLVGLFLALRGRAARQP
jgi:hypothetical protein